ncbi:MAG TPA: helix-turn-helix domain-containing protein [Gemmatimonadales bacterium]|nr:helix-turn-helix domain-containing protein [Gemmatimonadales bacterium]
MSKVDLTPFGFTPTESLVYGALVQLGPSTGYAVAHATRLARANAYGALAGLVNRSAATRQPGRPARYRPADPPALLAQLAAQQGEALDRLAHTLQETAHPVEPETRGVVGARALGNLILQLVARAERRVVGVIAPELLRPTLPAWRRAASRAEVELRVAGEAPADADTLLAGVVAAESPTLLVIDEAHTVAATGAGDRIIGMWSSHPVVLVLARAALRSFT